MSLEGRDEFFQASGLACPRSAGQDAYGIRQSHVDGCLLFF